MTRVGHLSDLSAIAGRHLQSRLDSDAELNPEEEFLRANKRREGVVTLPSGLQYKVLKNTILQHKVKILIMLTIIFRKGCYNVGTFARLTAAEQIRFHATVLSVMLRVQPRYHYGMWLTDLEILDLLEMPWA